MPGDYSEKDMRTCEINEDAVRDREGRTGKVRLANLISVRSQIKKILICMFLFNRFKLICFYSPASTFINKLFDCVILQDTL